MWKIGIWTENFRCAFILRFAMARWKLSPSTRFEIFHFQPVNCRTSKNYPICPKVFQRFSKTLLHLKRDESGNLGRKFHVSRYFSFAMTRWKLSPSKRFEIFQIQPVNCPSKNPIYLQMYLTDFKKLCFISNVLKVGIWAENFMCAGILVLQRTRWKLSPSTRFEIFHFQPVNCTSKNPISPKVFNRFSKTLLHLKLVESGYLGRTFQVRRYFTFANDKVKTQPIDLSFEIFHVSTCKPYQQKCHISKGI